MLSTYKLNKLGISNTNVYQYVPVNFVRSDCMYSSQRTLSPFCNVLQDVEPPVRTCSVDRDLFAECNLVQFPDGEVPSDFQVCCIEGPC